VSGADLAAIKKQRGAWVLSDSLNTAGTNPIGTIDISSIDTANQTFTVTLSQPIPNNPSGGYSYLVVAPPTDPYSAKLTNLWYSWANFYVQQLSGFQPLSISADVSADTDNTSDTRVLTFNTPEDQAKASRLMLGMVVTGGGITNQTTTVLNIAKKTTDGVTTYTVYLSAPVPSGKNVSFTFSKPAGIPYSNDPGLETNLINPDGFGADKPFAVAFAGSVYEMMSVYGTIPKKHTLLPNRSMDLVYEAIGGNVGFLPTAAFVRISENVRDLGKSVLRGVPDFLAYPDQHATDSQWKLGYWYPPPSTPTDGTNYNVFNLDPFVWFVHQRLDLSGRANAL
jgi:hypothetical protein